MESTQQRLGAHHKTLTETCQSKSRESNSNYITTSRHGVDTLRFSAAFSVYAG